MHQDVCIGLFEKLNDTFPLYVEEKAVLKSAFKRGDRILEWPRPGSGTYQRVNMDITTVTADWNYNKSIFTYKNPCKWLIDYDVPRSKTDIQSRLLLTCLMK